MQYGLIGEHLGHSYSREIHERIGDYTYELQELRPEELRDFLRRRDFRAINVTIPYKQSVIPYLDEISDTARRIHAVNTIVCRDGRLYGDNTDFAGMTAQLRRMGLDARGKKVLILGTGGTSRTAYAVMESMGAGEIWRISRTPGDGVITYEEAVRQHGDAALLINTTPVGMYPHVDATPIDMVAFPALEGVMDAIYHPLRTDLVLEGERRGIPAAGGLYMLAAQAVYAAALFCGTQVTEALVDTAFRGVRDEKENLVLIGMPSSGKSTVGRLLAEATGKPLVDTDELVLQEIGMPIADYFAAHGEAAFRAAERRAVAVAAQLSGHVIATGGGVVLSGENVHALRRNGRLIFLDRRPDNLIATSDRPLSSDREKLMRLYGERYPLYTAAADVTVDSNVPPPEVAAAILKEGTR